MGLLSVAFDSCFVVSWVEVGLFCEASVVGFIVEVSP